MLEGVTLVELTLLETIVVEVALEGVVLVETVLLVEVTLEGVTLIGTMPRTLGVIPAVAGLEEGFRFTDTNVLGPSLLLPTLWLMLYEMSKPSFLI